MVLKAPLGSPPTARLYLGTNHRVDALCPHCDHWRELSLAALVEAGRGDTPLIALPLRCGSCGKTGHKIIVSGDPTPAHSRQSR